MTFFQRPARHRGGVPACVLVAAVFGGCGGGQRPSDRQLVTQALRSYLHAQAAGDGQAACAVLTAVGQKELIALVMKAGKRLITTRPSCQDAVGLVRAVAGSNLLSALSSARIEHVQVSGVSASAEVVDGTGFPPQHVLLEKAGTAWKIAGVPGLGG
jgi:hypothetical protein